MAIIDLIASASFVNLSRVVERNISTTLDITIQVSLSILASNTLTLILEHSTDGGNTWILMGGVKYIGALTGTAANSFTRYAIPPGRIRITINAIGTFTVRLTGTE